MTVGITELPPEGMQLPGVALAGDADRGTKTTEGISLLFTTAGITVQGPQPQIERLLVWSALDSATCHEVMQLADGRQAAIMELTSGGQSIRFLLPTDAVSPGQAAYLDQALPTWLARYKGSTAPTVSTPTPHADADGPDADADADIGRLAGSRRRRGRRLDARTGFHAAACSAYPACAVVRHRRCRRSRSRSRGDGSRSVRSRCPDDCRPPPRPVLRRGRRERGRPGRRDLAGPGAERTARRRPRPAPPPATPCRVDAPGACGPSAPHLPAGTGPAGPRSRRTTAASPGPAMQTLPAVGRRPHPIAADVAGQRVGRPAPRSGQSVFAAPAKTPWYKLAPRKPKASAVAAAPTAADVTGAHTYDQARAPDLHPDPNGRRSGCGLAGDTAAGRRWQDAVVQARPPQAEGRRYGHCRRSRGCGRAPATACTGPHSVHRCTPGTSRTTLSAHTLPADGSPPTGDATSADAKTPWYKLAPRTPKAAATEVGVAEMTTAAAGPGGTGLRSPGAGSRGAAHGGVSACAARRSGALGGAAAPAGDGGTRHSVDHRPADVPAGRRRLRRHPARRHLR